LTLQNQKSQLYSL